MFDLRFLLSMNGNLVFPQLLLDEMCDFPPWLTVISVLLIMKPRREKKLMN